MLGITKLLRVPLMHCLWSMVSAVRSTSTTPAPCRPTPDIGNFITEDYLKNVLASVVSNPSKETLRQMGMSRSEAEALLNITKIVKEALTMYFITPTYKPWREFFKNASLSEEQVVDLRRYWKYKAGLPPDKFNIRLVKPKNSSVRASFKLITRPPGYNFSKPLMTNSSYNKGWGVVVKGRDFRRIISAPTMRPQNKFKKRRISLIGANTNLTRDGSMPFYHLITRPPYVNMTFSVNNFRTRPPFVQITLKPEIDPAFTTRRIMRYAEQSDYTSPRFGLLTNEPMVEDPAHYRRWWRIMEKASANPFANESAPTTPYWMMPRNNPELLYLLRERRKSRKVEQLKKRQSRGPLLKWRFRGEASMLNKTPITWPPHLQPLTKRPCNESEPIPGKMPPINVFTKTFIDEIMSKRPKNSTTVAILAHINGVPFIFETGISNRTFLMPNTTIKVTNCTIRVTNSTVLATPPS